MKILSRQNPLYWGTGLKLQINYEPEICNQLIKEGTINKFDKITLKTDKNKRNEDDVNKKSSVNGVVKYVKKALGYETAKAKELLRIIFQLAIDVWKIDILNSLNYADILFFRNHLCHPTYFGWNEKIKIVLCNIQIHNASNRFFFS